jgi:DNA-binding response OmpR family regulator
VLTRLGGCSPPLILFLNFHCLSQMLLLHVAEPVMIISMAAKKKILVVDDDKNIVDFVQNLLNLSGYDATIAVDGRSAITKAREILPNLILLDIMMPNLNGIDTCHIIKDDAGLKSIPVIMLTSLSQMNDIEKAFAAGASDYMTKPFDAQRLLQKIKKHLGE